MEENEEKEEEQGVEVIEKTRWEGGKAVVVERVRRMKRRMDEMKRV